MINLLEYMKNCKFITLNLNYPPLTCLFFILELKPFIIIKNEPKPIIMLKRLRYNGNILKPRNMVSSNRKAPKMK